MHGSAQQAELLARVTRGRAVPRTGGPATPAFTCEEALYALLRAKDAKPATAIVGLRECIFSNRVGALGAFAASSEYAFSSVMQPRMADGGVRLHYGHPDVFLRTHVMTRVSAAAEPWHLGGPSAVRLSSAHRPRGFALPRRARRAACPRPRAACT